MIGIKPLKKRPDNVYTYLMVRFMVEESFRGVSGPRVSVGTATTMCDTKFKKGKRYLVYASLDDKTNQFFTGMCTGTTLAVDIDDRLKELRKLTQREAEESISGRIKTNRYQGLPGIKIEVISKDETFKTMTTKYGDFFPLFAGSRLFHSAGHGAVSSSTNGQLRGRCHSEIHSN